MHADESFYLIKELLMTERTYKKDLELIAVYFRNRFMDMMNECLNSLLFVHLDPMYQFHLEFLKDLEFDYAQWYGCYIIVIQIPVITLIC